MLIVHNKVAIRVCHFNSGNLAFIRLAKNWGIISIAMKIKPGTKVSAYRPNKSFVGLKKNLTAAKPL